MKIPLLSIGLKYISDTYGKSKDSKIIIDNR